MMRALTAASGLLLVAAVAHADPSLECSVSSGSQVETSNCLVTVAEAADAALEVMLDIAQKSAAELDSITERDVAVPALAAAQDAWAAYRDAQCDYAGSLFGGGSGTGIEIQSCRIALTRARTAELESALR